MPGNIISITPADIASWPAPNYVDPMERTWLPAYTTALYAVSTAMVALRLLLRLTKKAGEPGLDDLLLVGAWLGATMFSIICNIAALKYYLGRHVWDIPENYFVQLAEYSWLAEFSFLVTGCCTKISVLLFYRRLVGGTYSRSWHWAVVGAILFTAAWSIALILTLFFNCTPTEAYWKAFDPNYSHKYTCTNTTFVNLLAGIFAATSDFYSVVLPLLMTKHFGLPSSQKVALNSLFCLGLLVVGASAVRTYYMYELERHSDVSWCLYNLFVWAQLELQLGIMCTAAPALRVFFRSYISAPFNRARHATRSIGSQQSAHHESRLSGAVIRRVGGPDDHHQRDDFSAKHNPKISGTPTVTEREVDEADSPSSKTPSSHYPIRSPAEYEAYSLRSVEKYRESLERNRPPVEHYRPPIELSPHIEHVRFDGGGRGACNFSQPFGSQGTRRDR